ncbi:MAG: fibrobacter succinogenes major paralogous domain-containing protein [Bacteroidales bacterium]|jgi:uncharacterized protein (TIGR02145 family)
MKKKNRIWISILTVIGFVLILQNSCKKADETSNAVADKDGNVYKTVTIGTQVWMAENLKTTKYLNGDLIGTTTPATLDISSDSTPKYQWAYGGDQNNVATYGLLYTWYAVTDSRNICPTGWHVPTDVDWSTLTTYLGGDSIAGRKLKETGTTHWASPNTGATNETGFTSLPGGYRGYLGGFYYIGYAGYWWSVTEYDADNAWYRGMYYNGIYDHVLSNSKKAGFSVRCLKN